MYQEWSPAAGGLTESNTMLGGALKGKLARGTGEGLVADEWRVPDHRVEEWQAVGLNCEEIRVDEVVTPKSEPPCKITGYGSMHSWVELNAVYIYRVRVA